MRMHWSLITFVFLVGLSAADRGVLAEPAGKDQATTRKSVESGPKKVELKLDLPKPLFIGTPKNIKSANLGPVTGARRPPFLVPEGTRNLSMNKPVSSSETEPVVGELELITDGDKGASDGSFVELGPGLQWVQIDLQTRCEIYAVVIWHYHAQARVYHDVVATVSDDPDFLTGVKTVFNNDHDNSAGLGLGKDKEWIEVFEGKLIDAKAIRGRYVRLASKGNTSNDMNHYVEVEVYGKPVE